MSLSDKWTRATLRTVVRRELLDPNGRWWTDTELNQYLDDWQTRLQDEFEFVWGTSSVVTSTSTLTLASVVSDMGRLDAVYWNNYRLSARTKQDLETLRREWKAAAAGSTNPKAVYQNNAATISFWPPLSGTATIGFEYPKLLSFTNDTTAMQIPAWTKYSAGDYVAWRAYSRLGANFDMNRALRRKARFEQALKKYRSIYTAYLPDKYLSLRPASTYELDILNPRAASQVTADMAIQSFQDYSLTGTKDGVNPTFTIPVAPTELMLFKNRQCLVQDLDFTLSGYTITFLDHTLPQADDSLVAWVYRA